MLPSLLVAMVVSTKPTASVPSDNPVRMRVEERRQTRASRTTKPVRRTKNPAVKGSDDTGYAIEVVEDDPEGTYGARITVTNQDTKEKITAITHTGDPLPVLKPGTYQIITEASRMGFPQEARYDVVDARTGEDIESFARSHVAVNNIELDKGQRLRVTVLGATRSYNAVFYHIGDVPVAHLFTRPYPSQDFGPGEFNGTEQFSAAPIAIAFWGTKAVRENPALATQIETEGVPGLRKGERIKDPVLVLGVRHVMAQLADVVVAHRGENWEDYRGNNHTTFLILRTESGKTPASIMKMTHDELATAFEQQLLWMIRHNVHRPAEGGGYAGKSLLDDIDEAKKKLKEWPTVSHESTEYYRGLMTEIENGLKSSGPSGVVTLSDGSEGKAAELQKIASRSLLKAAARERMNLARYDADTLREYAQQTGEDLANRDRTLREIIDAEIARMKIQWPGEEADFLRFQRPQFDDNNPL